MASVEFRVEGNGETYLQVPESVLEKRGWKKIKRTDTHSFMVLVKQGTEVDRAFVDGKGFFAIHQVLEADGQVIKGYTHIDELHLEKLSGGSIMSTKYDRTIGHSDYTILEKRTD